MPSIGLSIPRREGRSKVTGRAQYVDDLTLPGMLFGATVRSAAPRGLIKRIDFDPDVPWSDFVVVTAADVPGVNRVALIVDDQPCLAADRVNHPEEPVVLLAHPDRHLVEEARRRVHIVVDPEPAVFSMDESLAGHTIVWGRDNIFKNYVVTRGDVDAAIAAADVIVEGEYETGAQEQLYIEPNGMVATASPADGVTVWGSMQCPYYIHKALKAIFNLPADKVRVVQMETGGGFGGKEEYPSIIACHAALLAWKAGAPVKLVYDRAEDMVATTKRHPSRTRHRTAVTRDGRLVAMDIDFVIDGGAYCTLSPVVLSRGTIHSAGPYLCPNVRLRGRAVATNAPPHGAFRGFGAPQSLFALERHMDRVAAAVGLTPDALRRRNFIRAGDTSAVGQVMRDPIDMAALLDRALSIADYHAKRARFDEINPSLRVRKGIGLATFMHGAGFTGSGEDHLASVVAVEAGADGRVRVLSSNTEIGQGTNTIFAQIAADTLGVPLESIEIAQPDTVDCARQRPDRRVADVHGGRQTGRDSGTWSHRRVEESRIRRRRGRVMRSSARALPTRRGSVRFAPSPAIRRPQACAGTTRRIRAMPTEPMRGRSMWPKCRWTRRRGRRASTTLSPCRKWGRSSIPRSRPARSRAASRRRSAGRSTSASSGGKAGWPTAR